MTDTLEQEARALALRTLMRMASYSAEDGLKLATSKETLSPGEVGRLDLFGVSSFKWSGSGGEVKFFDRMRALELMLSLDKGMDVSPDQFYQALRESAAGLEIPDEEEAGESD